MKVDVEAYRADFKVALDEIHQLFMLRFVWKNVLVMLSSPPAVPPTALVNNYLLVTYTRTLAVGIRRQCEVADSRPTIGSLLRRVRNVASVLDAAQLGFDDLEPRVGLPSAWSTFADAPNQPLDEARVDVVLAELKADAATATQWVNRNVAHLDRTRHDVTVLDLDAALLGLGSATQFLHRLFNSGDHMAFLTPSPTPDWLRSFKRPWYEPGRVKLIDAYDLG